MVTDILFYGALTCEPFAVPLDKTAPPNKLPATNTICFPALSTASLDSVLFFSRDKTDIMFSHAPKAWSWRESCLFGFNVRLS